MLAQRWDRRATLVVAGAGFGKSTLLGQALAENLLAPRGVDLWLSLTPADRDGSTLLQGLSSAFAAVSDASIAAGHAEPSLAHVLSQMSGLPPGTCLVIDDLHEVEPGCSGHGVLTRVVAALPLQCSLLLGSRIEPALPLADWRAKGLVESIGEAELAYDDAELAELASAKGRAPGDLGGLGGWPALVELSLVAGRDGSEPYLRQVVLDRLSPRQNRWLGALHAIGGGDAELVGAAIATSAEELDDDARAEFAALGRLPAMQVLADGGFRPHALWSDALGRLASIDEQHDMQRRGAAALLARGDHEGAFELYRRCGDTEGMCSVVVDSCASGTWRYPVQTLQRWRDLLPAAAADRPEATLLAALSGREGATFDGSTVDALLHVATAFRERGDVGAEVAALAELAFVSREQGNTSAFTVVATRLFELFASGMTEIEGFIALVHATVAEAADLDQATLDALADLDRLPMPRQWRSRAHWLRAHSTVMLGRPEAAAAEAATARAVADDDFLGARYLISYVDWWSGVDPATVAALPFIGDEPYRTPFDCVYGGGVFAGLHAFAGNVEVAAASLAIAIEASGAQGSDGLFARPEYAGILESSRAAIEVARGRDDVAAEILGRFFDAYPTSTAIGRRVARRAPALVYTLLPGQRATLDDAPFGPAHDEVRAIGRWFAALRDGHLDAPPAVWPARLLNALPVRWAVEAAARSTGIDEALAATMLDQLTDLAPSAVRTQLRELADGHPEPPLRDGAERLLRAVPIRPDTPVRLSLLGPVSLRHGDSADAGGPILDRGTRTLVAALAVLGPGDAGSLARSIWPSLDSTDAEARLSSAVDAAHAALEPRRRPGDAPFLLRDVGHQLSLAPPPWLDTDLHSFDQAVARAADAARTGSHTNELEHLERALQHVSGPPLPDLAGVPAAASAIESVVATIIRTGQRAAALSFARGEHDRARRHAGTVLAIDPSNEACHQITVAAYADEGRTAAALAAFGSWAAARSSLGLAPSAEMAMLARRLGMRDPAVDTPDERPTEAAAQLAVQLLGRFAATVGDRPASIPGGKPQELVKLLAVAGRPLPEDEVSEVLWPGAEPEIGRRRLRNVIARVRAAGPFVERGEGLLALSAVVDVDLRRFESTARSALRGDTDLDVALAGFGGELLPADRFVEWTIPPRERVRTLAIDVLERVIERAIGRGDTGAAVTAIDRLLDVDPYAGHWAERAAAALRSAGQATAAARWDERAARIERGDV